uniref:Uncharacterized protein n=1 Tax=Brassica campestris TaxID=3711 RepID=A0A3P5ZF12_BRACM|nr:unnamed protein product [Brassica rapa]
MIRNVATKNLKDHPLQKIRNNHVQSRSVIHSYFLKGEPPDTNSIPKPKQFQEGGDDVVIRSATEPEVNPKPYLTSQGAKQNTCALKYFILQTRRV